MEGQKVLEQIVTGHPCYDLVEVQDDSSPSILIRMSARHEKNLFLPAAAVGALGEILTRIATDRGW